MKISNRMKLKEGMFDEYKLRHSNVFPELEEQFSLAGVSDYTIWYDQETNYLFAIIELQDIEIWNNISNTEACKKWWAYMAPLMDVNIDNSPISTNLIQAYSFKK